LRLYTVVTDQAGRRSDRDRLVCAIAAQLRAMACERFGDQLGHTSSDCAVRRPGNALIRRQQHVRQRNGDALGRERPGRPPSWEL
jgi:hypothetical protein